MTQTFDIGKAISASAEGRENMYFQISSPAL